MIKIFNILNYEIRIEITNSDNALFGRIADSLLSRKKLFAIKLMKDNFEITLKDAKTIGDIVCKSEMNNKGKYQYKFYIDNKKDIIKHLKVTLGKYERKHIIG